MFSLINAAVCSEAGLASMFDEWVYGLPDRAAYMKHYIEVFGQRSLDRFRARSYYSAPANYGVAFSSGWDTNGLALSLGVDMKGLEQLIEEKGELVDVK